LDTRIAPVEDVDVAVGIWHGVGRAVEVLLRVRTFGAQHQLLPYSDLVAPAFCDGDWRVLEDRYSFT